MPRRIDGDLKVRCTHPGCTDSGYLSYINRDELRDAQVKRETWKCGDHDGSQVRLTHDCVEASSALVVSETFAADVMRRPDPEDFSRSLGLFFKRLGGRGSGCGRESGHGWYALAEDFPPGTRLEMTVRVVLPETEDGA